MQRGTIVAGSVNKVILVGNLGNDPEIKTMQSGDRVANLSVATSESWKDKATGKDYLYEYFAENMIILAERYNVKGDKFPANPKKEVKLLDVSDRTASVKLIADDWIDYMHLAKLNGTWKIVSVLWQFNDQTKHQ